MGASSGRFGTVRMQHHLRQVLVFVEALLTDPAARDVIAAQLEALATWTRPLAGE